VLQVAFAVQGPVEDAAVRFHQATGAGPFLLRSHVEVTVLTYHEAGTEQVATMDHSIALGQWGEVMVELVQHHTLAPSGAASALTRQGAGLHHVATMVDHLDVELERLRSVGHALVLRGSTVDVDFGFVQLADGGLLEVYQRGQAIVERYRKVRDAAAQWDGRELFLS
jgi:hypothetical protein